MTLGCRPAEIMAKPVPGSRAKGGFIALQRRHGCCTFFRLTWGFPQMGVPTSWMVYFMENPNRKWMMTRGTPISGNLHF